MKRWPHTVGTCMPDPSRYLPAVCWCLWDTVLLKAPVVLLFRALNPVRRVHIWLSLQSHYTARAVRVETHCTMCESVCLPARMAFPGWVSLAFPAGAAADRHWGLWKGLTSLGSPDMVLLVHNNNNNNNGPRLLANLTVTFPQGRELYRPPRATRRCLLTAQSFLVPVSVGRKAEHQPSGRGVAFTFI